MTTEQARDVWTMPLRKVVRREHVGRGRHRTIDILECGHRIEDRFGNTSKAHHCPECPPLPPTPMERLGEAIDGLIAITRDLHGPCRWPNTCGTCRAIKEAKRTLSEAGAA